MKHFILGALTVVLLSGSASAQVVLNIKDGNGSPQTIAGHNGGGASLWLNQSICDPLAANQCATVSLGGGLKTVLDTSGTPPTVNLGTIGAAATAANQTATIGPVAPGTAATNSQLGGCVYNSSAPTPGSTQQVATQCDNKGNVYVDIASCAVGVCGLPTVTANSLVKGTTAAMTATTSTQVVALVAAQRLYITSIHCNNSSATGTLVTIQDGPGGTTLDTLAAGATFGGDNRQGGSAPLFWTTAGNGLYAADVTTGASVICQASGYSSAN